MHPTRAAHERWIPTTVTPARRRAARATALSLALGLTLLGADAARANSLTFPVVSPGAQATVPVTITVSGEADPVSSLRVYVQHGDGGGCASQGSGLERAQAQSVRPGSTEVINRQPLGPFTLAGTYTPPVAGQYSVCAYLFGSAAGSSVSMTSSNFNVGPAPPPPPAGTNTPAAPGATGIAPRPTRCVVPSLTGRTYLGARKLIRRAGCSVGTVYRPGLRTARAERARGRVLRVTLQYPKPRSVRKLNSRLMLRLSYVNPRRSRR